MKTILTVIMMLLAAGPLHAWTGVKLLEGSAEVQLAPAGASTSVIGTVLSRFDDPMIRDAFGRIRVSQPLKLFDSKQISHTPDLFWDQLVTGGATAIFQTNDAATRFSIPAGTNGMVIRQTRMHFDYQPGNSQLFLFTGRVPLTNMPQGAVARAGYFTADYSSTANPRGIWWEIDSTNIYTCIGKPQGTVRNVKVRREDWNVDPMDGTGPSGIVLQPNFAGIYGADFEWLGVGAVRFFVVVNGAYYIVHKETHGNELVSVYMSTPNLPMRYELDSGTNILSSTAQIDHICSSVSTEGGFVPNGVLLFAGNNSNTAYSTGAYGVLTGVRLRTNHFHATLLPSQITSLNTDNTANYQWIVALNPQYTGSVSWAALSTDHASIDVANPVSDLGVTNLGTVISSGFVADDASSAFGSLESSIRPGHSIAGEADQLMVLIRAVTGTPDVSGGIQFRLLE